MTRTQIDEDGMKVTTGQWSTSDWYRLGHRDAMREAAELADAHAEAHDGFLRYSRGTACRALAAALRAKAGG